LVWEGQAQDLGQRRQVVLALHLFLVAALFGSLHGVDDDLEQVDGEVL
jgi:hypothetical protein